MLEALGIRSKQTHKASLGERVGVLIRGRQAGQSQRLEDATLLALRLEEGATSQGMRAASASWREHSPANSLSLGLLISTPAQ